MSGGKSIVQNAKVRVKMRPLLQLVGLAGETQGVTRIGRICFEREKRCDNAGPAVKLQPSTLKAIRIAFIVSNLTRIRYSRDPEIGLSGSGTLAHTNVLRSWEPRVEALDRLCLHCQQT